MSDKPEVGVAVILMRADKVLLLKRQGPRGPGTWTTPGGHMDLGETPEQCGAREAKEEIGVDVVDLRFRAITNDIFEGEGRQSISVWMDGRIQSGEPRIASETESSDIGWFSWAALPQPLYLPLENFVKQNSYPPK